MRNIFTKIAFTATLAALIVSCKKSELTSYDEGSMVYIYKEAFNTNRDSASYSFAIKPNSLLIDTVKVAVRIMGAASTTNREVKLAAVSNLTTALEGVHYTFLPYVIPAGAFNADLPIVVKRTADMKTQEYRLQVQVVESKDFQPGISNSPVTGNLAGASLQYLVKINDFLTKPSNWDTQLVTFFGTFSQEKFKFIISVTGKTDFRVGASPLMSFGEVGYYKALCKSKLLEYVAINGPLIDEFGAVVTFP